MINYDDREEGMIMIHDMILQWWLLRKRDNDDSGNHDDHDNREESDKKLQWWLLRRAPPWQGLRLRLPKSILTKTKEQR